MKRHAAQLALILGLCLAAPAGANDSSAELAAGGLVLTHNPAIEMRSEDLFISPKLVRVRYRFLNTSDKDVTVLVAFPMPDVTIGGYDDTMVIPTDDPTNLLGFHTTIDGKPVAAQVEQKVIANGVDQTAYLRSLGMPLAAHLESTGKAADALPKATRLEMVKRGLGRIDDDNVGPDGIHHFIPTWTLKTKFFWRQTFPAGRELAVEHSYTPSVGSTVGTSWGEDYFIKDPHYAEARRYYCVDDEFLAALARGRARAPKDSLPFSEQRIEYILSTGANWKAPIADFKMTIDKGDPRNLISFCGEGVHKISPTTFEMHQANYTPTREVSILILVPASATPPS